ncbi:MAG TPA: hypothetical protein VGZ52_03900, partial [Acidimicrobiales bacterium]|nr:hypothetical protein [Acidimicrobiales bacterium]
MEGRGLSRGVLPITVVVLALVLLLGIAAGSWTVVATASAAGVTVAVAVRFGVERVDDRLRSFERFGRTKVGAVTGGVLAVGAWVWVVVASRPAWRFVFAIYWTTLASVRVWQAFGTR